MHPQVKQPNPLFAVIFLIGFAAVMLALVMLFNPVNENGEANRLHSSNTLTLGLLEQRTNQLLPEPPPSIRIVEQLAAAYGWELRYLRYASFDEMTTALAARDIDVIADMVIDNHPVQDLNFSRSYDRGQPALVYFPGLSDKVASLAELPPNSLLVINGSWQERYLARQQLIFPQLYWQEVPDYFGLQGLIESIATSPGGYSLTLERELAELVLTNPELTALTGLEAVDLGYGFRGEDDGLIAIFNQAIDSWTRKPDHRPKPLPRIDRIELHYLLQRMDSRLPKYIDLIVEAGREFNLDWRLIAAIAYQESHWNEDAVSPTGVRGLMMLTETTAASVGTKDRTDPRQSLFGGTRYFLYLRDQIPARIPEPDRSWFALAAYNVGFAHVEDVRIHTQRQGGNPDNWEEVNANLHLLEDPDWYPHSKYGYGRGREARNYVANIRKYFEVLLHLLPADNPDVEEAEPGVKLAEAAQQSLQQLTLPERILARY